MRPLKGITLNKSMEQKSQVLLVITKTTKGPFGNFFKNNISISTYLEHTWYVQISWAASAATVLFMKQSEKKIRSKVMTPFSDCLSLPFVMPEIYHEQFEQKMGTPTRHYHHYLDESIIKSGRPMSSALISQPFSLTLARPSERTRTPFGFNGVQRLRK